MGFGLFNKSPIINSVNMSFLYFEIFPACLNFGFSFGYLLFFDETFLLQLTMDLLKEFSQILNIGGQLQIVLQPSKNCNRMEIYIYWNGLTDKCWHYFGFELLDQSILDLYFSYRYNIITFRCWILKDSRLVWEIISIS